MAVNSYKQKLHLYFGNNAEIHDNCEKFLNLMIAANVNDDWFKESIEEFIGTFEPMNEYEEDILFSLIGMTKIKGFSLAMFPTIMTDLFLTYIDEKNPKKKLLKYLGISK